ncbi:glycoside hydrolase family 97 protein [Membranihabitans maritimus]|uniref:glycoside hydrolase family 97 protein n=1 Tax=Membranihabitans maritimus TaxID=2904244 RepID=UPI001F37A732|nr:glycoside hydrolase family 97 protein [Membranihabitans maritimus]
MKKPLLLFILAFFAHTIYSQNFSLTSIDGKTKVSISIDDFITWKVEKYGKAVLPEVNIDLKVNGHLLSKNLKIGRENTVVVEEEFPAFLPLKSSTVLNHFKELQLTFENNFRLDFRVYNNAVAYRFSTSFDRTIEVDEEVMNVHFPNGTTSFFPLEESTYSHYERSYITTKIDTLKNNQFGSLPILFDEQNDVKILFSEADVFDYPQLFLKGSAGNHLSAMHPKAVAETIPQEGSGGDRNVIITEEHPYIARTEGTRNFPWRFFVITDDDTEFIEQNLVLQLSRESQLKDISWIRPGKVAWDWWNANNVFDVDFESGLNTETYKYYIDFASEYGLEYVILDEGWTKSTTEILAFNPDIEVQELIRYGNEKNVRIILWCLWKPLDENMEEILDTYAKWGAAGIKVDFMQRGDQYMTKSYEIIARECAERKLLVDFHGAFKPGGLRKAFPNIISYEGVKGNEHHKWSHDITPTHNTILPFVRMAVGPMDYTPGAMHNTTIENHFINFDRPMSMGTRAHQIALYTIFESALQMLCDTPSAYYKNKETIEYISQIPTIWDETIALQGETGEYVVIARRKDTKWYVGAITNNESRHLELDLSFLPSGEYNATIYRDGINAKKYPEDFTIEEKAVNSSTSLTMNLQNGGGWSAILVKK